MSAPTIGQVIAAQYKAEQDTAEAAGLVKIGTVKDFAEGRIKEAWLFTQAGGNHMAPIKRANSIGDVWVNCGGFENWYCCCANTPIYGKSDSNCQ